MIRPDQIPDEAVEAAARDMALTEWGDTKMWDVFIKRAESAIAAAINAWSGACEIEDHDRIPYLALPLPQENQND